MWYAKRIIDGEVISIATYEQNKPVFTDKEKLEWEEINIEEYNKILSDIKSKSEQQVQEPQEDIEITDEEV